MKKLMSLVVKTIVITIVSTFTIVMLSIGITVTASHFDAVKTKSHSHTTEHYTVTANK